ncbi:MAG: hypothetical protein JW749_10565 [Sedimentisphaerales bacterium]|nr:hypothetical protein [Sedimentisphaerales bacterium]
MMNIYWQGAKIAKRPYKQGLYSDRELGVLRNEYPKTSAVVLAEKLNRSLISVQRELRELGMRRRKQKTWTPDQLKTLRTSYKTTAIWEIANKLNKTPSEIKRKADRIGLKK